VRDVSAALMSRRDPGLVSPLVVLLSSRECPVTGEAYSVMGGRFGRVFVGVADGWLALETAVITPEDVVARFDEIRDLEHFTVPAGTVEEIRTVGAAIEAG
jgi:hypothetical protein